MKELLIKIQPYLIEYGLKILAALLIFIIGKYVARFVSKVIEKAMLASKLNQTLVAFIKNIAYYAVMTFVIIAALNKLGIETSSFVMIIGAAGLAVGLALQGTLANF